MNIKSEHHLCLMLAFVQRKAVAKLDWKKKRLVSENQKKPVGISCKRDSVSRCTDSVSLKPSMFQTFQRRRRTFTAAAAPGDKSFQGTTSDSNQRAFELEKDSPWSFPRFVPVCSWLGSLDSPSPAARIAHLVPFCLFIMIFCWPSKKKKRK